MEKSLRVCPIFKLYWVDNTKVKTIKRYDHNQSFVTPEELFAIIKEVYSHFDTDIHTVKYRDGDELIDISKHDVFRFQFTELFYSVLIYIFSSRDGARNFIPPWKATHPAETPKTLPAVRAMVKDMREWLTSTVVNSPRQNANTFPALVEVHPNITCDLCGSMISSTRYKCLECTNFDLCADCEKEELHKDHLMVVVPVYFLKSQGVLYQSTLDSIVASTKKSIPQIVE